VVNKDVHIIQNFKVFN